GAGRGAARREQDHRQPQGSEHEPERRPEVAGNERPAQPEKETPPLPHATDCPLCPYLSPPGFHSGSVTPAAALATRERMNRRSESRFRYTTTSGLISCSPAATSASRSARLHTV